MRRLRRWLGLVVVACVAGVGLAVWMGADTRPSERVSVSDEACPPGPEGGSCGERDAGGPPVQVLVPVFYAGFLVVVGLPVVLLAALARLVVRRRADT